MAKEQRHTPEQVIGKLRETEVELASVRDAEVDKSEVATGYHTQAQYTPVFETGATRDPTPEPVASSRPIRGTQSLPLPYDATILPHDLASVIDAWPLLPEAIRAGIVAMVRAAAGLSEA